MAEPPGYTLTETLRQDGDWNLRRGQSLADGAAILTPTPAAAQPPPRRLALTREWHNETAATTVRLHLQLIASLNGMTREPASLDDAGFSEAACLERFAANWFLVACNE